jgi:hypothetical protein
MNRRYDIDALRVLAFGLLILYHASMLYVADWDFHLKSSHTAAWLQDPMLFLNRWRMELLFLVSGLAVNFMRRRASLPGMAWKRTVRLLLPLVFGMLVVIPIQPYVQGLSTHLVQPGFGHFLLRYWTGGPWPAGAFTGWQFGFTWNHLWYLPYLWVYTMLLMALLPLLESTAGQRLRAAVLQLRGPALLVLPAIPLFVWDRLLADRYPFTGALWGDWYAHALYISMFLYGYLLGTDAAIWSELARLRRISLPSALTCFALYLAGIRLLPDSAPTVVWWVVHALRYAYLWTAICTVLGWGHAYLNRPFRWLPYARDAVYPWYVLHQSLLLLFAWQLMPLGLGPVLEPVLIITCTIGGCAVLHECVIRRVRWLRPVFGMEAMPRVAPMTPALMAPRMADDIA